MGGSSFRWNPLTSAFSREAVRNEFFKALFSNFFFHVVKHSIPPSMEHKLKKNKKDALGPVWKIEAFKPRDRHTTKAVACLEISEKTLKRYWRCELNLFCPIFFPLVLLYQWGCSPSSPRGATHPSPSAGTATALHSPLVPVAQLKGTI